MTRIFLTGGTGAIGSALAPLLLDDPEATLTLLLRGKRGRSVAERLRELGDFWGWRPDDERWQRVETAEGDAALPRFGLTPEVYDSLANTVSHIIHCAGAVKMTLPLEEARAHAVVPAEATLELAERSRQAGALRKVEFVSTVGVGGRTPGLIPERPMPEVTRFHNTYEAAKSEAERLVFGRWDNLPITVHRPSMVVGDSRTGRIVHFQVFYHLCEFLSGQRTAGLMPNLEGATLDLIPADYVARAIQWSAGTTSTAGRILHLCSGPAGAVGLPGLVTKIRERTASGDRSALPRVRYLPLGAFRLAVPLLGLFAPEKVKRALGNLELFLAYLEELQTFANEQTVALLRPAGITVPAADAYLDIVLDYYRERIAARRA